MIKYSEVKKGDILRVVGVGMPGYAKNGDLVKVTEVEAEGLWCMNSDGIKSGVVFLCGAVRLEPVDFDNEEIVKIKLNEDISNSNL